MVQNKTSLGSGIILVLLRGKAHLREIARKLNEPHSTVLRRLNELVRENVLDYGLEGRNRVFFIKNNLQARSYVYSAERHKLLELVRRYPTVGIILEDLTRKIPEGMIVVFGSYAKFSAKPDSDLDIYIGTEVRKLKYRAEDVNSRIRAKVGRFDTGSLLIKEIMKNHVIVRGVEEFYEKSGFFEQA